MTAVDAWALLQDADVVVTHGGQNALAEVAAARRPAVVVPQDRPYDEQRANAAALDRGGLALVRGRVAGTGRVAGAARGGGRSRTSTRWSAWSDGAGRGAAPAALLDGRA